MFITFEGIEGSGKTTQINLVEAYLIKQGREIIKTKEPGGTPLGMQIRQWLLNPEESFGSPYTELLLFYADRLEHISKVIEPALAAGKIVLCDRFVDSTIAYQQGARGMPKALISQLNALLPIMPKLTFLLDLSVEEGLKRAKNRAELDRFEHESVAFHQRVRQTYLDQAVLYPDRIKKISVEGCSPGIVFDKIRSFL